MDRPGVTFPDGFFDRADDQPDCEFYEPLRLVTHLDNAAIAEVGRLYSELELDGDVLDLMSSWISPFEDGCFDAVTCCVSVDYLVRPVEVFADVARMLRRGRLAIVNAYFEYAVWAARG